MRQLVKGDVWNMQRRFRLITVALLCFSTQMCFSNSTWAGTGKVQVGSGGLGVSNYGLAVSDFNSKFPQSISDVEFGESAAKSLVIQGRLNYAVVTRGFSVEGDAGVPPGQSELAAMAMTLRSWHYLPLEAYSVSLIFNLRNKTGKRVSSLKLSPSTISKIFTGEITNWSDRRITIDNGTALLPKPIIPVVRSDGSSSTWLFTSYLASQANATWSPFAKSHGMPTSVGTQNFAWVPPLIAQSGSQGIAQYVTRYEGTIGYVETDQNFTNLPVVSVRNKSGNFSAPTAKHLTSVIAGATFSQQNFLNFKSTFESKKKDAYPITGVSYLLTTAPIFIPPECTLTSASICLKYSRDEGKVMSQFLKYYACDWQNSSTYPSHVRLSKTMISRIYGGINHIWGHVNLKPLSNKSCASFK